jgi:tRNA 2-selenouridine synthase
MQDSGTHDMHRAEGVPAIAAAELLGERAALVIDLRSPSEFAEDHVPGAHNLPLFDDAQRALVGTLYHKQSPAAAFAEGREIVVARIAQLRAHRCDRGRLARGGGSRGARAHGHGGRDRGARARGGAAALERRA